MKYLSHFQHQKILFLVLSLFQFQTSAHAAEVVLQSIVNLDNDDIHTDEGNLFKLIKLDQGCKIEARIFISYENTQSEYYFQNKELNKASVKTYRYHYQKDNELSLMHVTDVYQYASAKLDIQDNEVKQDFNQFKALFPSKDLKLCER